jgi:hypothetical protein
MINSEEEKIISSNTTNYYHLVNCNTHVFGEPFLEDDFLYYFDGDVVTLLSRRLTGETNKDIINKVIAKIIKKHSPKNLIFWGVTTTLEINEQEDYKLHKKISESYKKEFIFETASFIPSKKYKYCLNIAKRENLKINHVETNYYKHEYTKLISETHLGLLDMRSLSYYSIFPNIKNAKFVEILKGDKLISVNIIIEVLPNYVCFAEIGYDKSFNRASGVSKALLIESYLDKTKYISWGGCNNEGIFKYKKELIGKTPICFDEDDYVWYEFYQNKKAEWWLMKMKEE